MPPSHENDVRDLLSGLSVVEIREIAIDTLRRWYRTAPPDQRDRFTLHGDLGRLMVPTLAARKSVTTYDANTWKEPFVYSLDRPWMMPLVEFTQWLVSAGFGVPAFFGIENIDTRYPFTFRLTERGHAFLATDDPHPLVPSVTTQIEARCPDLPPEVSDLFEDARLCLDRMLLRPALVVFGVGFEVATARVLQARVDSNALGPEVMSQNAARRIATLREQVPIVFPGRPQEPLYAAIRALDYADLLRQRRNDAAHTRPRFGFDDRAEVEELIVSGWRHLPALWALRG